MAQERTDRDYGRDDDLSADDMASDASTMTEGVGGVPDLDDDDRATVGDVDGDNVRDGEVISSEKSTDGSRGH